MARQYPRLRSGDPLEPRHLNVVYKALERWERLQGAGGITVRHGDPPLILGTPYELVVMVKTPGGGIPARNAGTGVWGTATVTHYDESLDGSGNPKSVLGSRTEDAYNKGPGAIPGGKDAFAYRDLLGRLIVFAAYC